MFLSMTSLSPGTAISISYVVRSFLLTIVISGWLCLVSVSVIIILTVIVSLPIFSRDSRDRVFGPFRRWCLSV